jgi:hypothetical protein
MVVIATPNTSPAGACCSTGEIAAPAELPAVSAAGQNLISAPVSTVNGQPLLNRMRAITITQGQCATINWQLHDRDGKPVDLTPVGFNEETSANNPYAVVLRLNEQLALGNGPAPVELVANVVEPETGRIEVPLTAAHVALPGIYYAEAALVTVNANPAVKPCVIFSNTFSLIISRSTFGEGTAGGPPSMAEIRLHLRDSSPSESFLLDRLMFDDAEIALAIQRPVQYWNEIPPPIGEFTTQNFPFRYHWLEGICANLFFMVAEGFRRNQLSYSAAGLSLDDQNKEPNYERAGQMRWDAYRQWVRAKKAQINLEGGYGEVGSLYQYGAYSSGIRSRY